MRPGWHRRGRAPKDWVSHRQGQSPYEMPVMANDCTPHRSPSEERRIAVRTGSEYSPRPDEKDTSGKCTDNATKQWKEMERAHFRKICIKHGLIVD